jgi:hypothetical protein
LRRANVYNAKQMFIPAVYPDQKIEMVSPRCLDDLIADRKIIAFRRSSGWVLVTEDPIRNSKNKETYKGPERRRKFVVDY